MKIPSVDEHVEKRHNSGQENHGRNNSPGQVGFQLSQFCLEPLLNSYELLLEKKDITLCRHLGEDAGKGLPLDSRSSLPC